MFIIEHTTILFYRQLLHDCERKVYEKIIGNFNTNYDDYEKIGNGSYRIKDYKD